MPGESFTTRLPRLVHLPFPRLCGMDSKTCWFLLFGNECKFTVWRRVICREEKGNSRPNRVQIIAWQRERRWTMLRRKYYRSELNEECILKRKLLKRRKKYIQISAVQLCAVYGRTVVCSVWWYGCVQCMAMQMFLVHSNACLAIQVCAVYKYTVIQLYSHIAVCSVLQYNRVEGKDL